MPVIRSSPLNLAPRWTLDAMAALLKSAFTEAGFSAPPDEFTLNGRRFLVWQKITDAARTYGKFYFALSFNGSGIKQAVCATYDAAANAFPDNVQWSETSYLNSTASDSNYQAIAIRSSEAGLVYLTSAFDSFPIALGWIRPSFKPVFWDENIAPYAFVSRLDGVSWITTERNFYQTEDEGTISLGDFRSNLSDEFPNNRNPINGQIDILSGVYLYPSNRQGIAGALGGDWGRATDNAAPFGSIIAASNGQQFMVFNPNLSFGSGVVRIL